MTRPTREIIYMAIANTMSQRATCCRRSVGCVLVNKRGHILSTGYNGVASGMEHCTGAEGCQGARSESGTDLGLCEAIHAEQNALLQCRDVYDIDVCYTTTQPCIHCVKLLLNTSCTHIVYRDAYPSVTHKQGVSNAERLWLSSGRTMHKIHEGHTVSAS